MNKHVNIPANIDLGKFQVIPYFYPALELENIEVLQARDITKDVIHQIYNIERDMWARWLWEYMKCRDCWKVFGKNEVFGVENEQISLSDLEKGASIHTCDCCGTQTTPIYSEEYKQEIWARHLNHKESFLVVYRDTQNIIRGFFDGYVSDFDTLFENELSSYYSIETKEEIKKRIQMLGWNIQRDILCPSALWTDVWFQNMYIIHALMYTFYYEVYIRLWRIDAMYESVLWTNTHAMYEVTGAKKLGFWWLSSEQWGAHSDFKSDIFFHPNVWERSITWLSTSMKEFMRQNGRDIKMILSKYSTK